MPKVPKHARAHTQKSNDELGRTNVNSCLKCDKKNKKTAKVQTLCLVYISRLGRALKEVLKEVLNTAKERAHSAYLANDTGHNFLRYSESSQFRSAVCNPFSCALNHCHHLPRHLLLDCSLVQFQKRKALSPRRLLTTDGLHMQQAYVPWNLYPPFFTLYFHSSLQDPACRNTHASCLRAPHIHIAVPPRPSIASENSPHVLLRGVMQHISRFRTSLLLFICCFQWAHRKVAVQSPVAKPHDEENTQVCHCIPPNRAAASAATYMRRMLLSAADKRKAVLACGHC